ncbi:hypothetical protein PGB34_07855 [Xenophilus arseniciresistens]|uniref:Uncharacterized protein n=1 Tax=Xenophilus arseniciresistens TaxID=1283306 RepID=A0AAE3N8H3_9BURK|nr:hypothetical protein [Xenophilus arseniciresistens]MDA7416276.1 hypothetical protein [Xenophilus arseniciresistens]
MSTATPSVSDTKRSTGAAAAAAKSGKVQAPDVVRTPPPSAPATQAVKEEPEPRFEPAIPSDGRDEQGEQMMEELGRERREKQEKTGQAR